MIGKIKTLAWFLARPSYWSQMYYAIKFSYFASPKERTAEESVEWCSNRAITTEAALDQLMCTSNPIDPEKAFSEEIKFAREAERACPVTMGGAGDLKLLFNLAYSLNASRIVETGVAYGWSSLAFLLAIKDVDNAMLFSTDMPYIKRNNEQFVGVVVPESLKSKWKLYIGPDRSVLPEILQIPQIDICHYDSDKTYLGRMFAYPKLWAALKPGGIFISDDIQDNVAFRDFAFSVDKQPLVVEFYGKYIGILVK